MARSRGELEEIIKRGEAVLLTDGRVITSIEDLPSAVELAGDDIVKRQQAVADLEAAAKKAQADLEAARAATAPKAEAKTEAKAETAPEEFAAQDPTKADKGEDKAEAKSASVGRKAVEK